MASQVVIPDFDELDLVVEDPDPDWLEVVVDPPHGCPHHEHLGAVLWWEHVRTGELRCVECWRESPPNRSMVRRIWLGHLETGIWPDGTPLAGQAWQRHLYTTPRTADRPWWPWDDKQRREEKADRENFHF